MRRSRTPAATTACAVLAPIAAVILLSAAPLGVAAAASARDDTPDDIAGDAVPAVVNPAAEASRRRMEQLAEELRKIADTYGPDAVVLQTKLLIESVKAGALGPTEVKVSGPTLRDGRSLLLIEVATGLIFDSTQTSPLSRTTVIWDKIAAPVLDDMGSFNMEPAGLELAFSFGVQDPSACEQHKLDPTEPSVADVVTVSLAAEMLQSLAAEETDIGAVREASAVRYGEHLMKDWPGR